VSATVTQLTPQGLELSLSLNATNPNGVDLSSQGMTAHVVLDKNVDLGTVTSSQAFTLSAGKATSMTVPLSVPWNSVLALVQLGARNTPVPYAVDGSVMLGGALLNVSVPFHLDGSVSHEKIVSATMRSIPQVPGITLPR
jgi:LEA14-like dessication related protein